MTDVGIEENIFAISDIQSVTYMMSAHVVELLFKSTTRLIQVSLPTAHPDVTEESLIRLYQDIKEIAAYSEEDTSSSSSSLSPQVQSQKIFPILTKKLTSSIESLSLINGNPWTLTGNLALAEWTITCHQDATGLRPDQKEIAPLRVLRLDEGIKSAFPDANFRHTISSHLIQVDPSCIWIPLGDFHLSVNIFTSEVQRTHESHKAHITAVALMSIPRLSKTDCVTYHLWSGSGLGDIMVWKDPSTSNFDLLDHFYPSNMPITNISQVHNNALVATQDGVVQRWNIRDRHILSILRTPQNSLITGMTFHGNLLVAGSRDGFIRFFEAQHRKESSESIKSIWQSLSPNRKQFPCHIEDHLRRRGLYMEENSVTLDDSFIQYFPIGFCQKGVTVQGHRVLVCTMFMEQTNFLFLCNILAAYIRLEEQSLRQGGPFPLLKLLGIVSGHSFRLVFEGKYDDTLRKQIHSGKFSTISSFLKISLQICQCVSLIHSAKMIHFNIHSDAFLVSDDDVVKLSPFHMMCARVSRDRKELFEEPTVTTGFLPLDTFDVEESSEHPFSQLTGSLFWKAPELFDAHSAHLWRSPQSDVYSLGLLLYEMIFQATPFSGEDSVSAHDLIGKIQAGYRPQFCPLEANEEVLHKMNLRGLVEACWVSGFSFLRPTADQLVIQISAALKVTESFHFEGFPDQVLFKRESSSSSSSSSSRSSLFSSQSESKEADVAASS